MKIMAYTKDDTARLKGLGILLICLHNYFHWLWPSPGENEFSFSSDHIFKLFDQISAQPGEFFNLLLSFFGHFGVQMFIFISGYGLAASMMKRDQGWGVFVVNRLKKLYPLLLTGLFFFILFGRMVMERTAPSSYDWREMGYKMLLIHTLLPDSGLSLCGPWWFFGLIFQFYLLFPLLYWLLKRYDWKAFLIICLVTYGMIFSFREAMPAFSGNILMQNSPAHLPEFCFGIWLCLNKDRILSWIWLPLAVALFCLGNFFQWFYPFTFLSVAVMTAFLFHAVKRKCCWGLVSRFLVWLGGLSMTLFATHGFLRVPFLTIAEKWNGAWGHFFTGLLFFVAACLMALAAKHLYDSLLKLFDKIPVVENRTTKVLSCCAQVGLCLFAGYVLTYYIVMNVGKKDEVTITADSIQVNNNDEFISLANFPLTKDGQWLRVKGDFYFVSSDTTAELPLVVIDVAEGLYWNAEVIPSSLNDDQQHHFEFEFAYKRPFLRHINDKPLKLYLWNKKQGAMIAERINAKLLY